MVSANENENYPPDHDGYGSSRNQDDNDILHLKFRNYTPRDDQLKKYVQPAIDPEEMVAQALKDQQETLNHYCARFEDPQTDFVNMIPKKPNWDLKRDVAPKLAILEKRTHVAIAKLVKEKIQRENSQVQAKAQLNMDDRNNQKENEDLLGDGLVRAVRLAEALNNDDDDEL